jgi:hypothetical protein
VGKDRQSRGPEEGGGGVILELEVMTDATTLIKKRNKSAFTAIFLLFPAALLTHTLLTLQNFDIWSIALGAVVLLAIFGYILFNAYRAWVADSTIMELSVFGTTEDLLGELARQKRHEMITPSLRSVEDRLDELERLKRRDMVTPEEYAAKRQEILKDL